MEAVLLVEGQRHVDRHRQIQFRVYGGHGQDAGHEPLHVGRSSAVDPAVAAVSGERRRGPVRRVYRDDVRVPREDHPTIDVGTDGGEQVGLRAAVVVGEDHGRSEGLQAVPDVADQVQIRGQSHGVVGDQNVEEIQGFVDRYRHHTPGHPQPFT